MIVKYSSVFIVTLKKANVRIRKSFKARMTIFLLNPNDLQLHNHALKDEYEGKRSIDITNDWRAIFEEIQEGEDIIMYFVSLGTHAQLYKS